MSERGVSRAELQRRAVHAVPETRRLRAVGKDMTEMAAAVRAVHLGPHHQPASIEARPDRAAERTPETRPAGAAVEFRVRREERMPAAGAEVGAPPRLVVERAAERPFRC